MSQGRGLASEYSMPRYSILISGRNLKEMQESVKSYLISGIKVFWIGATYDFPDRLFDSFQRKNLLIICPMEHPPVKTIVDGRVDKDDADFIMISKNSSFDSEQYLAEHCNPDSNILVRASAGTGKTTVMINRTMFLLRTVDNLSLSDICMITFTNKASQEMQERLQKTLLDRFILTHDTSYLEYMEQMSSMHIGTIHSFELDLVKRLGTSKGLSNEVSVESLAMETNDEIDSIIDEIINPEVRVASQLGSSYHDIRRLVVYFWKHLSQKGLDHGSIADLDWGDTPTEESEIMQETIKDILSRLEARMDEVKRAHDSISLVDVQCDLKTLMEGAEQGSLPQLRYLFIDEFQDTDDAQIAILSDFLRANTRLFVVGDVKQSIYRFRGANSNSFDVLVPIIKEVSGAEPDVFELFCNYRTSPQTLSEINRFFHNLSGVRCVNNSGKTLIPPYKDMVARRTDLSGGITTTDCTDDGSIARMLSDCIEEFNAYHKGEKNLDPAKDRIVALVRTNYQLNELERICHEHNIPSLITKEGSFYQTRAVRDLKNMLGAFIYPNDPVHLYNYLDGPYSGMHDTLDLVKISEVDGQKERILELIKPALNQTSWSIYMDKFKESPTLAVLQSMVMNQNVLSVYESQCFSRRSDEGYEGDPLVITVKNDVSSYASNLKKLLELLHDRFGSTGCGMYDLYEFLKVQMATNHDEREADAKYSDTHGCIHCMTVHSAKGLEFDTVVIPFTDKPFHHALSTRSDAWDVDVLIDQDKIGWAFRKDENIFRNSAYEGLTHWEKNNETAEETRLLYVAMTRAIRNIILAMPEKVKVDTWAYLIQEYWRRYIAFRNLL